MLRKFSVSASAILAISAILAAAALPAAAQQVKQRCFTTPKNRAFVCHAVKNGRLVQGSIQRQNSNKVETFYPAQKPQPKR